MKIIMVMTCLLSVLAAELPEPYKNIEILPFDGHGWFVNPSQINAVIKKIRPKTVIEVGSWLGQSTRFIANLIDSDAKIYCIDTWSGAPLPTEDEKIAYGNEAQRLRSLYQQFLSNIIHAKLTHKVIPIRMESIEAAHKLNLLADLIYIDAAHSEQAVYDDITEWISHLNTNGVLCGDDWHWSTVRKGVEKAAEFLNMRIYHEGNFWLIY